MHLQADLYIEIIQKLPMWNTDNAHYSYIIHIIARI